MTVDWSDPCARVTALRDAYYKLVSGQQVSEIEYRSNDTTRRRRFNKGDTSTILSELRTAESECAALTGETVTPRRFGIRGTFHRE